MRKISILRNPVFWIFALITLLLLSAGVILLHNRPIVEPESDILRQEIASGISPVVAPYIPKRVQAPRREEYIDGNGMLDYNAYSTAYDLWKADNNTGTLYPAVPTEFLQNGIPVFLENAETENATYAPLSLYLALGMLSEVTDGNTQAQVLAALGTDDIAALRQNAKELWSLTHRDDGIEKSLLASSLWMNDKMEYNKAPLQSIADNYFAATYKGTMGTPEYDAALRAWLNEQTDGLLREQTGNISLTPETALCLVTTVNYESKWEKPFAAESTKPGSFFTPGGKKQVSFMHKTAHLYGYKGKQFTAVSLPFANKDNMWLLLPNEGVTPAALAADSEALALIAKPEYGSTELTEYDVTLTMPKFDITTSADLMSGLKKLGITDATDPATADFSPLSPKDYKTFLSAALQDTRIQVEENGIKAVSYTLLIMENASAAPEQPEPLIFTLDRPFLFSVTGKAGPLFVGIVNNPQ